MSKKKSVNRRQFLTSSAVFGANFALAAVASKMGFGDGKKRYPVKSEVHKTVIIGSGFGGAVSALRLSNAGIQNLVIERGRRWDIRPDGKTFPTFSKPDRRSSWLADHAVFPNSPPTIFKPYTGLIELIKGQGMDVICGAGVGGSSLVYGAMMLKPSKELFHRVMPDGLNYEEFDSIFYPRVKEMIGFGKIPNDVLAYKNYLSTRLFRSNAQEAGFRVETLYNAVNWNRVRDEIAGRATPSLCIGELITGVNSGAKNSVDKNYLAKAEATGNTTIYPLHRVERITESDGSGGSRYTVECSHIDEDGNILEVKMINCEHLILSAGSMGTSNLLVKAKAKGELANLNDFVGKDWGNNGDYLVDRICPTPTLPRQGSAPSQVALDWDNPIGPVSFMHGPAPLPVELYAMPILGMGIPDTRGEFVYDRDADRAVLKWVHNPNETYIRAIKSSLAHLVSVTGGSIFDLAALGKMSTYHPLGGAVMGKACDLFGRVCNYKNLYVIDAALIPGSTGCCNPSWTVAANAERCLETLIREDFQT